MCAQKCLLFALCNTSAATTDGHYRDQLSRHSHTLTGAPGATNPTNTTIQYNIIPLLVSVLFAVTASLLIAHFTSLIFS